MKTILTLLLSLNLLFAFGQSCSDEYFCINFDDTLCLSRVRLDTATSNLWQVGIPNKPSLDTTFCKTKLIVTDTVSPYPVNNNSTFTIVHIATSGDVYGFKILSGLYYVQTDSLKDFGKIEVSVDKGSNWIDIINDTAYANYFVWHGAKPVLTGRSFTCRSFSVQIGELRNIHNFNWGDTLLYRFSFHSDSTFDNLGGLMFDQLCFLDFVEGVTPIIYAPIKSKIYPNPSSDNFTIEFENPEKDIFTLAVYDICSRPILKRDRITDNRLLLDTKTFAPGMYVYKLTNPITRKRSWGRFIVSEK